LGRSCVAKRSSHSPNLGTEQRGREGTGHHNVNTILTPLGVSYDVSLRSLSREDLVRASIGLVPSIALPLLLRAQTGGFPPDSLVNTKVIPKSTPVIQVIGTMRNFTSDLGVRCQFCHVGQEGQPLSQFNFVTDEKRTKVVARQMMLMVQEINRRVDT